ncbi:MAG: branched-chain amino acid ABC transporter permease [Acetobacteraceae bacterium]|nr:branched-chain amino acid ABC transporter permease [Acetobacteraceae bacterium]
MMQLLLDALGAAAVVAPAAVGFSLLFALLGFANFAVGAYVAVGAFATWSANGLLGWPLLASAALAAVVTGLVVLACDAAVFRPLRGAPGWALLISSVALSFVLENLLRLAFRGEVRGFDLPLARPLVFGDLRVPPDLLWSVGVAAIALVAVLLGLRLLPWGRALRAAADDMALAAVRGIPVDRLRAGAAVLGGALAGLSGTLAGMNLAIEPGLGWALTVPVIAAAILGGIGSAPGAVLGALLIALAEELAARFLSPAYRPGVGFVALALALLLRPQGLLGRPVAGGRDR